jgi:hypothetical protein
MKEVHDVEDHRAPPAEWASAKIPGIAGRAQPRGLFLDRWGAHGEQDVLTPIWAGSRWHHGVADVAAGPTTRSRGLRT